MTIKTRLAKGEIITVTNSQITNYHVVHHGSGHDKMPWELVWAYGRCGTAHRQVAWAFFPTLSAAAQAAEDLVNNDRNRVTGEMK